MKSLKILQNWPVRHNGKDLNRGDIAEFDDQTAAWLLSNQRAELIESPKTTEQETPERQAKIQAAVAQMLSADPNAVPKCPDIAAQTGLKDIRKEERDAAVAAFKAAAEKEIPESKGE